MNSSGTAWSISVNPYKNNGTLHLSNSDVPIINKTARSLSNISTRITQRNQLFYCLPIGTYDLTLYSTNGKRVSATSLVSNGEEQKTQLKNSLRAGLYILTINQKNTKLFEKKIMIK